MLGKIPNKHQVTIFQTPLVNLINMDHELVHLAQHIDWDEVENEFKGYFSKNVGPSVPVHRMVGLMLLKYLYNLSDEGTVSRWVENPYFQYFTGEYVFQVKPPIDPADFSKFRRRVGEEGAEKFLKLSIKVNTDKMANDTEVMVGTTVKERMQRNYLKGNVGDSINTMMAAAEFNPKHWFNKVIFSFIFIYRILIAEVLNIFTENRNRLALLTVGVDCEKRGFWQD